MIAFLTHNPESLSAEEQAAWKFLSHKRIFRSRILSFEAIRKRPSTLRRLDLLWWHFDSSKTLPPSALDPLVCDALRDYLEGGGALLLSLLAAQYPVDLGVEEVRPNVILRGPWSEESWTRDYPDIRGFATYRGHPVFSGFLGGLYTWTPTVGKNSAAAYYESILPKQGAIAGVEKLYITIDERRRNIVEYAVSKGSILAIGAHFYFENERQRYRKHLERFLANCLSYLLGRQAGRVRQKIRKTYWTFGRRTVEPFKHSSKPLGTTKPKLESIRGDLFIKREFSSATDEGEHFDLGGSRILIEGNERGGISEIWCHPIRILKDLRSAFRIGDSPLQTSNAVKSSVIVRPESLTRTYTIGQAIIEETVFADPSKPSGAIHYSLNSPGAVDLLVTAKSDLRIMWPLSEEATGSLCYAWDTGLHACLVTDRNRELVALFGCSKEPDEYLVGQYAQIQGEYQKLTGIPTDEVQVTLGIRLSLTKDQPEVTLGFAGSNEGIAVAGAAYRSIIGSPSIALRSQVARFRSLEERSVKIRTPDSEFNEAYRWALAVTDRFFLDTPGLGRSLAAGFGPSTSGWDGGHTISGRPGYAWYFGRDSVWTSLAVLDYGDLEKVGDVLEFLGRHQDVDGKILHELTTSGHAHYDSADATPLYAILMGRYLRAGGNRSLAQKLFPSLVKAMKYCFSCDTDGDHLIENTNVGHGWVEGGQLFPAHAEHYLACCWGQALEEAGYVASILRRRRESARWHRTARIVEDILRREFWNPETGFFYFAKNADGTFNREKTTLSAVGIYFGFGDQGKLGRCLAEFASAEFTADWGVRIVARSNPMFVPTGYHCGSVWPLFTGWTSLAEFAADRPVQGFCHLLSNLMLYKFFAPGYVAEVFHGLEFKLAGVCSHQAWSESMVIQPILEGMLRLRCDVPRRRLDIRPYFAPQWDWAEVEEIRFGDQRVHLRMRKEHGVTRFEFRTSGSSPIQIYFQPRLPLGTFISEYIIGTQRMKKRYVVQSHHGVHPVEFVLAKRFDIAFVHTGGTAVVPPAPLAQRSEESGGLRIIEERLEEGAYVLILEGKPGKDYELVVADPSQTVKQIVGANVVKRDGPELTIALRMETPEGAREYTRKQILFLTK